MSSTMFETVLTEAGTLLDYHQLVFRVVESQTYAATTSLVDDLAEQALLEQLLDDVKPPYKEGTTGRHYLISTPFRYPPLKYGSRFGDRTLPSYFYASENPQTALAECAFYRFAFLGAMDEPYQAAIKSEHLVFSVTVNSQAMIDLTQVTTPAVAMSLKAIDHYGFTQALGKRLVEKEQAKVIRYFSARMADGINLAIAVADEISSSQPDSSVNWIGHTTEKVISFNARGETPIAFARSDFCVDGQFPAVP